MTTPRPRLRHALTAALALLFTIGVAVASSADATKKSYQLPAGDAPATLRRFSEQSGEQILYPLDLVAGVRTNAVSGEFTAREALGRLVAGTELRVVQDERTGALAVQRLAAAAGGSGSVEGRVFNPASGTYVTNARVTIDALRLETFTDAYGQYRFSKVPAGDVTVRVSYTGFPAETQAVKISAGQSVTHDFTLRGSKETFSPNEPVKLDAFKVAASRDMAASDIAVNEQRYAPGIKNVVSTDSFGDIADGNVGEFAKYLPGVVLNRSGSDGINMSLGGVPPSGTPITVDGNALASAASSSASRTIEFENLAIGGMSRVEVSRSQNPDNPANAIGGSVNLISKSAFERSRPLYTLRTYLSFRAQDFSLSEKPGPFAKRQYPFEPNFEFTGIVPVTRNFGFTVNALVARTPNNGPGTNVDWVPTVAGQSANYPATTPDQPYLARYRLTERPKITVRESVSMNTDWRVSDGNVHSVGLQYAFFTSSFWVRQLNFDVGRVGRLAPISPKARPAPASRRS